MVELFTNARCYAKHLKYVNGLKLENIVSYPLKTIITEKMKIIKIASDILNDNK